MGNRCMCFMLLLSTVVAAAGCDREPSRSRQRALAAESKLQPSPAPAIAGMAGVTGAELLQRVAKHERGALVNMWASWCGSCKKELPMLEEVQEAFAPHGIGLVLVSADQPEGLPKAKELLDQLSINAERYYLAGSVGRFKLAVDRRWLGAIPATFLIDQQGKVRHFWNGPVYANEISRIVQGYLAGEDIDGVTDVAARPVR